ncbi:MAG: MFS transporter [Bacteroidetes bacterium]|nr:MFS transporter [Bacteroidota bacterium]
MTKERRLLLVLAAIQFNHIVDFMIMMPLGPQLMRILAISPKEFSLLVSSYTFSAGIVGFAGAFFLDRFERKRALQIIFAGFLIGTLACAFAPGYSLLMTARILTGAFGGLLGSLILSIIGDAVPLERRSSAMGIVMTAFSIASVVGVPAGLFLATHYSWHMPFLSIVFTGLFVQIAISKWVPVMKEHIKMQPEQRNILRPFQMVAASPNQQKALLLQCCLMLGHFSLIPFLSPYMVSNVGFGERDLPLIYLLGGAVSIISLPLIGKLADKYGRYKVLIFGICLSAIPQFLITNMPPVPLWMALTVTTFFFITTGGRTIPASTIITSTVTPQQRGSFMSLNVAVQQLSSGLAAYLAGLIISKGPGGELVHYEIVGYIAITFSFVGLYVAKGIKGTS